MALVRRMGWDVGTILENIDLDGHRQTIRITGLGEDAVLVRDLRGGAECGFDLTVREWKEVLRS